MVPGGGIPEGGGMAPGGKGPDWRDEASTALLLRHLPRMGVTEPILVMGEVRVEAARALREMGMEVADWSRRAFGGRRATPWPPEGLFGTVCLRMPRGKDELAMAVHGAAGALVPNGALLVYGAKDEGIASVPRWLEGLFGQAETAGVGGHCRLWMARRLGELAGHRGTLKAWREVGRVAHRGWSREWVSYPGVFAHGRLDPGTGLLLDVLPELAGGGSILDYGCGSGVVGAVAQARYPSVRLTLLDVDVVALEAARENVPGADLLLNDGLPPVEAGTFEAILSNPPFHRGKAEEPEMIRDLVRGASSVLAPGGRLVLVAQRRLPLEEAFRGSFGEVEIKAEEKGFRVWEGREPSWVTRSQRGRRP